MRSRVKTFPVLGSIYDVFAIPCNVFIGFLIGLAAPVAAIAAIVAGVRFLSGKMPFLSLSQDEEEKRRLSLELVSVEEAGELFAAEKQKVVDELGELKSEIEALIEEAKARAEETEAGA